MLYVKNTSGEKQMPFHQLSVDGTSMYIKMWAFLSIVTQ